MNHSSNPSDSFPLVYGTEAGVAKAVAAAKVKAKKVKKQVKLRLDPGGGSFV